MDPRQELDNVDVDSRVVASSASIAPAHDALLPPVLVLFTDQRTTGVAATRVFSALHVAGTQHVLRQYFLHVLVQLFALRPLDYRHYDLSQDAVVAGIYDNISV